MARKPQPNVRDNLVGAFRSFRAGTGMNPLATHDQTKLAMYERMEREGRIANGRDKFNSRTLKKGGSESFISKSGQPTTGYPHVHVIHHPDTSVDVVAAIGPGDHPQRITLRPGASGNQVNEAVIRMATYLPH